MPLDTATLCKYRLDRAKEDLLTAESNHQSGFYKAAINRSYYAIFHSIRAVNILDGFDSSKHSSVIAHFNQFFVHTGEFEKNLYKIIDGAYRIREKCDYSDFFLASKEDSTVQLERAKEFYGTVEAYVNEKLNEEAKKAKAQEEEAEGSEAESEETKEQSQEPGEDVSEIDGQSPVSEKDAETLQESEQEVQKLQESEE